MAPSSTGIGRPWACLLPVLALALLLSSPARALTELTDESLSGMTGDGLTFAWTDFRMLTDSSSYLEQAGSAGSNTCTATGNVAGNYNCWRRGDLRWFGLSVSSTGGTTGTGTAPAGSVWATSWASSGANMAQCTDGGLNGLGCPRGGGIAQFATHDNPYVLRAFDFAGDATAATAIGNGIVTYQGVNSTGLWSAGGSAQTVLQWLAPTAQENYRFAFWGEIEVGRGGTGTGLLKSQTLVQGNAAGSELTFYKFTQTQTSPGMANAFDPLQGAAGCSDTGCPSVDGAGTAVNNKTLALVYKSHLRGDFRFSVAQLDTTTPEPGLGTPVAFDAREGMYFRNVDAFVPLGQYFYQALTIDVPRSTSTNMPTVDGNFTLEIPLLPNRTAVFTRFYSLLTSADAPAATAVPNAYDYGYATARSAFLQMTSANTAAYMPDTSATTGYPSVNANYWNTHGYSRWGDWFICQGVNCRLPLTANTAAQADAGTGRNSWRSSGDGIFFYGLTSYRAYSYRTATLDVRTGNNQYTTMEYMANYAACTPGNSTAYATCGYGGAYVAASSLGSPVSSVSILPAENSFLNTAATGMGANANRNVIVVPANSALNLGDSRMEGLNLNYLRFTSYGAQF